MIPTKLQEAAVRYMDVATDLRLAKETLRSAQGNVAVLENKLSAIKDELSEHVGSNITNRCVAIASGRVLTLEWSGDARKPILKVFESDGEEISW